MLIGDGISGLGGGLNGIAGAAEADGFMAAIIMLRETVADNNLLYFINNPLFFDYYIMLSRSIYINIY